MPTPRQKAIGRISIERVLTSPDEPKVFGPSAHRADLADAQASRGPKPISISRQPQTRETEKRQRPTRRFGSSGSPGKRQLSARNGRPHDRRRGVRIVPQKLILTARGLSPFRQSSLDSRRRSEKVGVLKCEPLVISPPILIDNFVHKGRDRNAAGGRGRTTKFNNRAWRSNQRLLLAARGLELPLLFLSYRIGTKRCRGNSDSAEERSSRYSPFCQ